MEEDEELNEDVLEEDEDDFEDTLEEEDSDSEDETDDEDLEELFRQNPLRAIFVLLLEIRDGN
jgi:hypothetical protein